MFFIFDHSWPLAETIHLLAICGLWLSAFECAEVCVSDTAPRGMTKFTTPAASVPPELKDQGLEDALDALRTKVMLVCILG